LGNSYSSTDYISGSDRIDSTTNKWNIVTTDKKNNSDLDFSDFLNLMIVQLKNQDFMNPVDDSEYMTQMTQFASMQAMNELASYSKTNYAMSMVGKEVTASRYTVSGNLDTTTGIVEKVSLVNNEYVLYVGGKTYSLDQVMQVSEPKAEGVCAVDPSDLNVEYDNLTSNSFGIHWELPTEDEGLYKDLTYEVYYSKEGPFNTVEEIKEKGQVFGGKFKNVTSNDALKTTLTGLDSNTTYYVNVVVTDGKGNQAAYKPAVVKTKISYEN
jgi:hypothetical protein